MEMWIIIFVEIGMKKKYGAWQCIPLALTCSMQVDLCELKASLVYTEN